MQSIECVAKIKSEMIAWLVYRIVDKFWALLLLSHGTQTRRLLHSFRSLVANQFAQQSLPVVVAFSYYTTNLKSWTSISLFVWSWKMCAYSSTSRSLPAFAASMRISSGMLVSRNESLIWSTTARLSWKQQHPVLQHFGNKAGMHLPFFIHGMMEPHDKYLQPTK